MTALATRKGFANSSAVIFSFSAAFYSYLPVVA